MKKRVELSLCLLLAVLLSACTERVDIDLEESGESLLVVFAEITDEPMAHAVYLSRTMPYFENVATPVISGASVTLSDGDEVVDLLEDASQPGTYLTPADFAGVVGRSYLLQISQVDANGDGVMENYSAESTMYPVPPVDSVGVSYNDRWDGWEVELYSKDPVETEDYYLFKVYRNGVLYTDSIHNYWTTDDRLFNGNDIEGARVQYFDEEKSEIVMNGDTIMLEMAGISKSYYDFINGVLQEVSDKIPLFSGPSANPKGNISGGALGFFSMQAVSRGATIYEEETED